MKNKDLKKLIENGSYFSIEQLKKFANHENPEICKAATNALAAILACETKKEFERKYGEGSWETGGIQNNQRLAALVEHWAKETTKQVISYNINEAMLDLQNLGHIYKEITTIKESNFIFFLLALLALPVTFFFSSFLIVVYGMTIVFVVALTISIFLILLFRKWNMRKKAQLAELNIQLNQKAISFAKTHPDILKKRFGSVDALLNKKNLNKLAKGIMYSRLEARRIFRAVGNKNVEKVRHLLDINPLLCEIKNKKGFAPLHIAVNTIQVEMVELLLSRGANVNAKTDKDEKIYFAKQSYLGGETSLHIAAYIGYFANHLIRLLLTWGADVNARDGAGRMPLHNAAYLAHIETAKILLDHGADVNAKLSGLLAPLAYTPLEYAARCSANIISIYEDGKWKTTHDKNIIVKHYIGMLKLLIENGADIIVHNIKHASTLSPKFCAP